MPDHPSGGREELRPAARPGSLLRRGVPQGLALVPLSFTRFRNDYPKKKHIRNYEINTAAPFRQARGPDRQYFHN